MRRSDSWGLAPILSFRAWPCTKKSEHESHELHEYSESIEKLEKDEKCKGIGWHEPVGAFSIVYGCEGLEWIIKIKCEVLE